MNDERKINVCLAAPSLKILGGQSRQASWLLKELSADQSLEVTFVPHNPTLRGWWAHLQRIKYLRTVVTTVCYWKSLLTKVRRCDVLHVFSASYYSYLLSVAPALLIAKLYGKKSVLNYRSGEAEDHLSRWRLTARPTMRWASVIVVQSGYLMNVFKRFGLEARPIPSSINLDRFRFRERRPLRPVFLSNRLHEPLYNVACILRAFALIQRRHPDARLIVAGDGSQRAELEQLAADLGLRGVDFVGRLPYEKMAGLYDLADIYLNAPNLDNLPSSILEAYASGLPVVTTNAGGIPYILRHEQTGLLVSCDDHRAMADAALRLLEDGELAARLTCLAYEECGKYTAPAELGAWTELYRELANTAPTSDDASAALTTAEQ